MLTEKGLAEVRTSITALRHDGMPETIGGRTRNHVRALLADRDALAAEVAAQAPPAEARSVSVWVVSEEANVLGVWRAEALGARHLWQLILHDAPVFAKRYEMAEWVLDGALADLEALERELPSMDDMQWELVVYGAKRLRHCAPMVAKALAAAGLMGEEVGAAE